MKNAAAMKKYQAVIEQCRKDEAYKKDFLASPEDVLEEAGIHVEEGIIYQVIEEPKNVKYIVLPYENADHALEEYIRELTQGDATIANCLEAGYELRIVRNTDETHYLILPTSPETLSDNNLKQVVGGGHSPGNWSMPIGRFQ